MDNLTKNLFCVALICYIMNDLGLIFGLLALAFVFFDHYRYKKRMRDSEELIPEEEL